MYKKKNFETNQEEFWSKDFGSKYIKRNIKANNRINTIGNALLRNQVKLKSALELGCNVGYNLEALKKIYQKIDLHGVEINSKAYEIAKKYYSCYNQSLLEFETKNKFDLVFTAGVLIHQDPKYLKKIYKKMYDLSKKYIYISEYFSDKPVMIKYRNHQNKLFKRDFAKDIITQFPKLKIVDYGFHWKEDPLLKGNCDNNNWFLFKK